MSFGVAIVIPTDTVMRPVFAVDLPRKFPRGDLESAQPEKEQTT